MRWPENLIERINVYVRRLRAEIPGASFNRANAIRTLLTQALNAVEGTEAS